MLKQNDQRAHISRDEGTERQQISFLRNYASAKRKQSPEPGNTELNMFTLKNYKIIFYVLKRQEHQPPYFNLLPTSTGNSVVTCFLQEKFFLIDFILFLNAFSYQND